MLLTLMINILLVVICVLIHFTFMSVVAKKINTSKIMKQYQLLLHCFSGLLAHIVEILVFATAIFVMIHDPNLGTLSGDYNGTFSDTIYFSITTYTSLGYGDIEPEGWIRFTAGIETLLGLMMITWTASLLYLAMEKQWQHH